MSVYEKHYLHGIIRLFRALDMSTMGVTRCACIFVAFIFSK